MSDELDDLKAAMDAATPAPDADRKAANLRLAEENFARLQGSRSEARHTFKRGPLARIIEGVTTMLNAMTTKGGLTATTALVAVGLFLVLPQGRDMLTPPAPVDTLLERGKDTKEAKTEGKVQTVDENRSGDDAIGSSLADADSRGRADVAQSDGTESQRRESDLAGNRPVAPASQAEAPAEVEAVEESFARELQSIAEPSGIVADMAAPAPSATAKRLIVPNEQIITPEADTEAFANAETNAVKVTTAEPVSTFSIDVDTASYAVVRSSLMSGMMPPEAAVRVEEMVNYFPYAYPAPDGEHPFRPTITVMDTPWNPGTDLVHIGIQGTLPAIEDRAPLNLVFLIDTSGSMQDANKLPLLKQSFRLMLSELRPDDEVSIVTYAGSAGQVLEPTRAAERSTILAALDRLEAGGSTAGQAGLQQAYQVAEGMAGDGEVTRVILATDGDFNVGLSDPEALKEFIAKKRDSGTYLSVLGFGRGNLDDATMQALAQNGNGQASYIDTLSEARKVLVDQLTGALFPIANDVKIQIEFNPAQIAEYRLIGYETRALAREDFNNDKIDAGDIGAGHSVTAIYEVTPVGSDAVRNGPLRYGEADAVVQTSDELGFFKMRYKTPGDATSILIEEPILPGQGEVSDDARFSVAIAGFGQLLRGGDYLGGWSWDDAIALANSAKGGDPFGYRAEAVTLMRLAEPLSRN
jgi:Ca-activated chloride channel homolog